MHFLTGALYSEITRYYPTLCILVMCWLGYLFGVKLSIFGRLDRTNRLYRCMPLLDQVALWVLATSNMLCHQGKWLYYGCDTSQLLDLWSLYSAPSRGLVSRTASVFGSARSALLFKKLRYQQETKLWSNNDDNIFVCFQELKGPSAMAREWSQRTLKEKEFKNIIIYNIFIQNLIQLSFTISIVFVTCSK